MTKRKFWPVVLALTGAAALSACEDTSIMPDSIDSIRGNIVYTELRSDVPSIRSVDASGTSAELLLPEAFISSPTRSGRMVYLKSTGESEFHGVFFTEVNGDHIVPLLTENHNTGDLRDPVLAQNGRDIALRVKDPDDSYIDSLFLVNVDDTTPHFVNRSFEGYLPAFSPSSDRVAFFGDDGLRIADVASATSTLIKPMEFSVLNNQFKFGQQIVWMPDGNSLVYPDALDAQSYFQLIHISADGNIISRLTDDGAIPGVPNAFFPSISPDGQKIAYVATTTQDRWSSGQGYAELRIMNADGSENTMMVRTEINVLILSPLWSPDGEALLYLQFDLNESSRWANLRVLDLNKNFSTVVKERVQSAYWAK